MPWSHEQPQNAVSDGAALRSNLDAKASGQAACKEALILEKPPKAVNGCCDRPELGKVVRQTVTDVVEYFISPMSAVGNKQRSTKRQWRRKVLDRVTEFRLCVEMVQDCLDVYICSGERDTLSTAEETLSALNELLHRIVELTFLHRATAMADQRDGEAAALLQVVQSPEFNPEDFTQRLLDSGLGLSGLLEACLGELTDWQIHPTQAERALWENWDQTYKQLHRQAEAQLPADDDAWTGDDPFVTEVCCDRPACGRPACGPPACGPVLGPATGDLSERFGYPLLTARHFCGKQKLGTLLV